LALKALVSTLCVRTKYRRSRRVACHVTRSVGTWVPTQSVGTRNARDGLEWIHGIG